MGKIEENKVNKIKSGLDFLAINAYIRTGREKKYKARYAEQLVSFMAGGQPFDNFASEVDTTVTVLNKWVEEQPGFKRAKEIGVPKFKTYLMKRLLNATKNDSAPILKLFAQNELDMKVTDQGVEASTEVEEMEQIVIVKKEKADEKN